MQRFIKTFLSGDKSSKRGSRGGANATSNLGTSKSTSATNASLSSHSGSLFVCLDDASTVCHPMELKDENAGRKAREFTLAEHAKRVKMLHAKREERLKRVSKSDAFKEATRTYETFGLGSFATWVSTEDCISAASDDEVTVMFCGDFCVPNLHTLDDMHSAFVRGEEVDAYAPASNAQRMLDFYRWSNNFRLHEGRTHKCDPQLNTDFIALKLEQLAEANAAEGKKGFAFVIYDKKAHRLIVARDSTTNPMPLYWGLAADGEKGDCLFISTEEKNELFSECFPASSPFPKGAVFVAEGTIGWIPGEKGVVCGPTKSGETAIRGFRKYGTMPVRTIPRVNSSGQMCGNVFRVESFSDMIGDVVDVHDLKRHGSYPAMIQ